MKEKLIKYFKDKKKEFKKLKKKIANKDKLIIEQAETINYLIQEQQRYKEKVITQQREIQNLKKEIKELKKVSK